MFSNSHEAYSLKLNICNSLFSKTVLDLTFKALAQVRASQALLNIGHLNMQKQETEVPWPLFTAGKKTILLSDSNPWP